mmetsp:Transcript_9991/g.20232  ORF Transcript_9991/g.20232 Transcript_9991/m.20232 type:complete len:267 (-) Transcript_9991:495-1295(-)
MCSTQAMPSSSALCASMGPGITSPIACTEGTLVWNLSFTRTRPALSISMPRSWRPRPSVKGRRPMATRRTSASKVSASPPLDGSTVILTPSPLASALVTLWLRRILIPCFFMVRSKARLTSGSMAGTMLGRNSMTSTSAPRRDQTLPSSRPMMPPPITAIFLGTSLSASAPVELTTFSSSMVTPGRGVTSEPVARMMFLPASLTSSPSSPATVTSFAPVTLPQPLTYLTLFFLKRPSMPLVRPPTAFSFCFIILPTSMLTEPTSMP